MCLSAPFAVYSQSAPCKMEQGTGDKDVCSEVASGEQRWQSLPELVLTLCWCYYTLWASLFYHSLPAELLVPRAIAPDVYRP